MSYTIADVMTFNACGHDDHHLVRDVFFDRKSGKIQYVALDIGGWFDATSALVASAKFGTPDVSRGVWPVDLNRQQVEEQPKWKEPGWFDWLTAMPTPPHILVGPHGAGYDPMMLAHLDDAAAQARDQADDDDDASSTTHLIRGLIHSSAMLGAPAMGRDDQLGEVGDLLFDADAMTITHVVIDNQSWFSGERRVVAFDKATITRDTDDQPTIQIDLTQEGFEAAREQAEMENVQVSKSRMAPGMYFPIAY